MEFDVIAYLDNMVAERQRERDARQHLQRAVSAVERQGDDGAGSSAPDIRDIFKL